MESIFDNLKFEMEHEEMFPEKKLPTLDFKMWMEDNKIMYSFYQKEVANKAVINKLSALSENVKVASLTQNLIRRCKNTSELLPVEVRLAVIDEFVEQVLASNPLGVQGQAVRSGPTTPLPSAEGLPPKSYSPKPPVPRQAAARARYPSHVDI